MAYTKRDLIERSGLPDRTIRNYIARGLLPRPRGHGVGAEYDEEHMVRAITIGRMRADGQHIDVIAQTIAGWSTSKFKRYIARTESAEGPAAPSPPENSRSADVEPPSSHGTETPLAAQPPSRAATFSPPEPLAEIGLPDAPSWRIYPLITGLGLIVDSEASLVVRRIAAEIVGRYGRRS